jgi:Mrp family chromosome partitioning ATPase
MSTAQLRSFLLRNLIWILLVAAAAGAAAYAWSSSHERYTAHTDLLFQPSDPADDLGLGSANRTPDEAQDLATAQLSVVTSPRVVKRASDALRDDRDEVLSSVSAKLDASAPIVQVTATTDSATSAAEYANAVARAYVVERTAARRRAYQVAADELSAQLRELLDRARDLRSGEGPRTEQERAELDAIHEQYRETYGQQRTAQTKAGLVASDVSIVARATPPTEPNRKPLAMAIAAAILGAIVAFAAALFRERTGHRLREREDLDARTREVLLAEVPRVRTRGRAGREGWAQTTDAFSMFWIHARLIGGAEPRSILVTSAASGDGKSFVSERLAVTLAGRGQSVILVSGDLRRPSLERRFGLDGADRGLTDALATPADDPAAASVASCLFPTEHERLRVLPVGSIRPAGVASVRPETVRPLLERLQREADVIIFDSSPVLSAPETLVFAESVDLVLAVAAIGRSSLVDLDAALGQLDPAARNLGVVLNGTEAPKGYHPPSRRWERQAA